MMFFNGWDVKMGTKTDCDWVINDVQNLYEP